MKIYCICKVQNWTEVFSSQQDKKEITEGQDKRVFYSLRCIYSQMSYQKCNKKIKGKQDLRALSGPAIGPEQGWAGEGVGSVVERGPGVAGEGVQLAAGGNVSTRAWEAVTWRAGRSSEGTLKFKPCVRKHPGREEVLGRNPVPGRLRLRKLLN